MEKDHSLKKAEELCRDLKKNASDSYAHATLVKSQIHRLSRIEKDEEALRTEDVEGLIKTIEKNLKEGLQLFPNDSFLLAQEAELAKLLCEFDRVESSLIKSFAKNPKNGYVALQLARIAEEREDITSAQKTLKEALDASNTNQRLHFAYGKLLVKHNIGTVEDQVYHFRHSFTPGDRNHEAQLLYGRQLFLSGQFSESRAIFNVLKKARLPNSTRQRQSHHLTELFYGEVIRSEAWYSLIKRDGDGAVIRFDEHDSEETVWRDITPHTKVTFKIAFTMYGAEAFDVDVL